MKACFLTPLSRKNPYIGRLSDGLAEAGVHVDGLGFHTLFLPAMLARRPQVLHLHWLHPFMLAPGPLRALAKSLLFLAQLALTRALGVRIVWTIHNLHDHEHRFPRVDRAMHHAVSRLCHAAIVHCPAAALLAKQSFHALAPSRIHAIPHGNYLGCYRDDLDRHAARASFALHDQDRVLVFLGAIRPYKGVLELIDAFSTVEAEHPHMRLRLLIAGQIIDEADAMLIADRVADRPTIQFRPGFVPDDDVQKYMRAADGAVFPYRDTLTSGALLLAMSFGLACLAPRKGCVADTLDTRGGELFDPADEHALLAGLRAFCARLDHSADMGRHNAAAAARLDWSAIGAATARVYRAEPLAEYDLFEPHR